MAVVGDINDFQFSNPMNILKAPGCTALIETLPPNERYSYNFDGNAQALDHILVSGDLFDHAAAAAGYDIVHVNAGFLDQISDHDPQLVRLTMPTTTYASLCALAVEYSSVRKVAVRLCDSLRNAEREEERGKLAKRDAWLDNFIEIVEEQRGKAFTDAEATRLIALARELKR